MLLGAINKSDWLLREESSKAPNTLPLSTEEYKRAKSANGGQSGLDQQFGPTDSLNFSEIIGAQKNISLKVKLGEDSQTCHISEETLICDFKVLIRGKFGQDISFYLTMGTQFLRDNLSIRDY